MKNETVKGLNVNSHYCKIKLGPFMGIQQPSTVLVNIPFIHSFSYGFDKGFNVYNNIPMGIVFSGIMFNSKQEV